MKAHELAELLMTAPDADVVMAVPPYTTPVEFKSTNLALNNEANAWIVYPPIPTE